MVVSSVILDNIKFPGRGLRHLQYRDIVQHLNNKYGQID